MIRDASSSSVRRSDFQPVDTGKGKERLNDSGIRQLDSNGPRSSLVDSGRSSPAAPGGRSLVDTGRGARADSGGRSLVDAGRTTLVDPGKGKGTPRLAADQYVAPNGQVRQRSVQPLTYGRAQLKQDVGSATTWGSIKNSLPFMGRTTYGRVLDKLKAYEADAAKLTPDEKLKRLNDLRQDCAKWVNDHVPTGGVDAGSAKRTVMARMVISIDTAIGEASYDKGNAAAVSRDGAMAKVDADFADVTQKGGTLNAKTLFRENNGATKALTDHLTSHTPADYRSGMTSAAARAAKDVAGACDKPITAASLAKLDATQMKAVLDGASALLDGIVGGNKSSDIRAAAAALPQELVDTLKDLDARVSEASDGDAQTRYNAFVGTLFLRHAVPMMQFLKDGEGEPGFQKLPASEQHALGAMAVAMQYAANQSGEDNWGKKVPDQIKDQFRDFMARHAEPMREFMDAVLSR